MRQLGNIIEGSIIIGLVEGFRSQDRRLVIPLVTKRRRWNEM